LQVGCTLYARAIFLLLFLGFFFLALSFSKPLRCTTGRCQRVHRCYYLIPAPRPQSCYCTGLNGANGDPKTPNTNLGLLLYPPFHLVLPNLKEDRLSTRLSIV